MLIQCRFVAVSLAELTAERSFCRHRGAFPPLLQQRSARLCFIGSDSLKGVLRAGFLLSRFFADRRDRDQTQQRALLSGTDGSSRCCLLCAAARCSAVLLEVKVGCRSAPSPAASCAGSESCTQSAAWREERFPTRKNNTLVAGPRVGGGAEQNPGSEFYCRTGTSPKLVLSQDFVRLTDSRPKRVPKTRRVSQ